METLPKAVKRLIVVLVLAHGALASACAQENSVSFVVYLDRDNQVVIETLASCQIPKGVPAVLIWSEDGQEFWRATDGSAVIQDLSINLARVSRVGERSRDLAASSSANETAAVPTEISFSAVRLEELTIQDKTRDVSLLVAPPPNGVLLSTTPTFRRAPQAEEADNPKAEKRLAPSVVVLKQGQKELARVHFGDGETTMHWRDIKNLSADVASGLQPGEYSLHVDGAGATTFTVVTDERRREVLKPLSRWRLILDNDDPLFVQMMVEHLLDDNSRTRGNQDLLYLADAVDLLEQLPVTRRTAYLDSLYQRLLYRLQGRQPESADAGQQTGIPQVDTARNQIAMGHWAEALKSLEFDSSTNVRARALAMSYRAVVLAQTGRAEETAAEQLFQQALKDLPGQGVDLYRTYNNYANFLVGRAQDNFYNRAFRIASQQPNPIALILGDMKTAHRLYIGSLELAKGFDKGDRAAVHVNLARLDAILADVLRALGTSMPADTTVRDLIAASEKNAISHAADAAEADPADPVVQGLALEVRARLSFRANQLDSSLAQAEKSRDWYLRAGLLAGVESVERLLGLAELKQSGAAGDQHSKAALRHLLISHELAESLRERFPADRIGRARAGFLARRTYVNQRLVELLIAEGRDDEALQYAELAKARSLQDLLVAGAVHTATFEQPDLQVLLKAWPKQVGALVYYFGTDRGWVFLVSQSGTVKAFPLVGSDDKPLATYDVIQQTARCLQHMDHWARRASRQLSSVGRLDLTWQDELHSLFKVLIPEDARAGLQGAETLLIVPHHILHYLPFAALIVEPDPATADTSRMLAPAFLLDEHFTISYAPSLANWGFLRSDEPKRMREASCLGIVDFPGAPSLPGVEKDLKALRSVFGDSVRNVDVGAAATKSAAARCFGQPGLALVSTHGLNDAQRPLSSYLLFHPSSQDDGRLTAGEIFQMRIRSDTVVMGACYSGLAEQSPMSSDDLYGLQRAFLQSGARSVVSACWDVYDGTAPELLEQFFIELRAGKPAAVALANSQRAFLRKYREQNKPGSIEYWIHPYFWSVYTLTGDDRTIFAE